MVRAIFAGLILLVNLSAFANFGSVENRTKLCLSCHGTNGFPENPNIPVLADQNIAYLYNQLLHFKSKERRDITMGIMNKIVEGMTDDQLSKWARMFSEKPPYVRPPVRRSKNELALILEGQKLAKDTCVTCHVNPLTGRPYVPEYPVISGQNKEYLYRQLVIFQKGWRDNPLMAPFVGDYSDAELKALSIYFESL